MKGCICHFVKQVHPFISKQMNYVIHRLNEIHRIEVKMLQSKETRSFLPSIPYSTYVNGNETYVIYDISVIIILVCIYRLRQLDHKGAKVERLTMFMYK